MLDIGFLIGLADLSVLENFITEILSAKVAITRRNAKLRRRKLQKVSEATSSSRPHVRPAGARCDVSFRKLHFPRSSEKKGTVPSVDAFCTHNLTMTTD
jgi:hypothetical protein